VTVYLYIMRSEQEDTTAVEAAGKGKGAAHVWCVLRQRESAAGLRGAGEMRRVSAGDMAGALAEVGLTPAKGNGK